MSKDFEKLREQEIKEIEEKTEFVEALLKEILIKEFNGSLDSFIGFIEHFRYFNYMGRLPLNNTENSYDKCMNCLYYLTEELDLNDVFTSTLMSRALVTFAIECCLDGFDQLIKS